MSFVVLSMNVIRMKIRTKTLEPYKNSKTLYLKLAKHTIP